MTKPPRPDYRPPTSLSLGPLFEQAPYQRHSETSKAAAKGISRELGAKQTQVWQFIRLQGPSGAIDNEIITHFTNCEWSPNTPRARRVELVAKGLVVDSGRQRNGSTVWVATSQAQEKTAA